MVGTWGPLQVLVVGFGSEELLQGRVRAELARLRERGLVRLVDAVILRRSADGELTTERLDSDVDDALRELLSRLVQRLLGLDGPGASLRPPRADSPDERMADEGDEGEPTAGLGPADLRAVAERIAPGTAVALVLVEHTWAGRLREQVRAAGGRLILQGILTREAVLALGHELAAVLEAEEAAELAAATAGAAMASALAVAERRRSGEPRRAWTSVDEESHLEQVADDRARELAAERTSAAGETLRVLMRHGLLAETSGPPAVKALLDEGVIDSRSAAEAVAAGRAVERARRHRRG